MLLARGAYSCPVFVSVGRYSCTAQPVTLLTVYSLPAGAVLDAVFVYARTARRVVTRYCYHGRAGVLLCPRRSRGFRLATTPLARSLADGRCHEDPFGPVMTQVTPRHASR